MIYFVVTDRFANGDTSNDNFGKGEYNPKDIDFYHGGDLKGLTEKLDYIKGLGTGAIWITPPIANQWISPIYGKNRYAGYHGYWAQDFFSVDAHLGDLEAYKTFVREAHKRGMAVIQDIVCNHMGDFSSTDGSITSEGGYPEHPAKPFDDQSVAGNLFHYNGKDVYSREFSNLDDLNTDNPVVADNLLKAYEYWIKEADIDGYRIDTAVYVPMSFWQTFVPAIRAYAKSLGKDNFLVFPEDYEFDKVVAQKYDVADSRQATYTGSDSAPTFNSVLDFAYCGALTGAMAGSVLNGRPWGPDPEFGSFADVDKRFSQDTLSQYTAESRDQLVTFIDNHDMTRLASPNKLDGDMKALTVAVGLTLTLPGVPCLYYGTEQGFKEPLSMKGQATAANNRQDMWDSGYSTKAPLYQFVAKVNALKEAYPALLRGSYKGRIIDGNGGAVYSFSRILDKEEVVVVVNRSKDTQWAPIQADAAGPYVDALDPGTKAKVGAKLWMKGQSIRILVPEAEWKAINAKK